MARASNGKLSGGRELAYISQKDTYLASLLNRMITAVNHVANSNAASATGKLSPPDPIDSIDVSGNMNPDTNTLTVNGEQLHFTLTHNQALKKGVRYITEVDTDPNFLQPHVFDHGASRSGFINLPANDADNVPITYYKRSYAQYPGSDPSKPTVFGGKNGPTKILMTGSSKVSLLPSKGSGTAATNGQQGGKGLGTVLNRPAPGPKRNLA